MLLLLGFSDSIYVDMILCISPDQALSAHAGLSSLSVLTRDEGRTSLATATCQQKCDTKKSWRRYFALAMKKFYGDNFFLATNFFSWRRKKILVFVYIFENNDHYFGEGAANFKKFLITSE